MNFVDLFLLLLVRSLIEFSIWAPIRRAPRKPWFSIYLRQSTKVHGKDTLEEDRYADPIHHAGFSKQRSHYCRLHDSFDSVISRNPSLSTPSSSAPSLRSSSQPAIHALNYNDTITLASRTNCRLLARIRPSLLLSEERPRCSMAGKRRELY